MTQKKKKKPVVRTGQHKPYQKGTNEQVEERVEHLGKKLARDPSLTRFDMHKIMLKKFNITWSSTDQTYIPRAKKWVTDRAKLTRDQAKEICINGLIRTIKDHTGSVVVTACRALSSLYGLDAPRQVLLGGNGGEPIKTEDSTEYPKLPPARLRELILAVDAAGSNKQNGHTKNGTDNNDNE